MEIQSHLTPNETLLLQTRPNVAAHLFLSIIGMILLFVLGFAVLSGSGTESATCTINGQSYSGEECGGITNIIGYVLLVAAILVPLINYWIIRTQNTQLRQNE
jgi:hypothetical protein